MKLLLDANLSWRMTLVLEKHFAACLHVDKIPALSTPASDVEIWKYAKEHELVIVTNDQDFIDFVNLNGFPPKVVLLKTYNQSVVYIQNLLIQRKLEIEAFNDSDANGLLQII